MSKKYSEKYLREHDFQKKKSRKFSFIFLVIIIIAFILFFDFGNIKTSFKEKLKSENFSFLKGGSLKQTCYEENGYCIYENISSNMKYSEPILIKSSVPVFNGILSDYMVSDKGSKGFLEFFSGDFSSYTCVATKEPPIKIEYFYDLCEGVEGEGCGHERRAIICEDIYFVQDFTNSYGPRLYGPFKK